LGAAAWCEVDGGGVAGKIEVRRRASWAMPGCHGGSGSCSHGCGIGARQGTCDVRNGDLCRRQGTNFVARTHSHGGDSSGRPLRTELTDGGRGCVLAGRASPRHGALRTRRRSHPRELGTRRGRALRERVRRERAPHECGFRRGRTGGCSSYLGLA
jgi:hypothetical protein